MSHARQRLVDRTRFVFAVPAVEGTLLATGGLALLSGVLALGPTPTGAGVGLALVAAPAVVAVALTGPLDRARDGTFAADRSGLLALATSAIVATFVVASAGARALVGGGPAVAADATLVAAAGTLAFRLLVLVAVSGPSLAARLVPAAVQPVATVVAVVLVPFGTPLPPPSGVALGVTLLLAAGYAGIVVGVVALVDRPLDREHGISGFEFLHCFLEYLADGATELESVFESLGDRDEVPVVVLAVRDREEAEKARVVVPLAHPGPLAGVGGGTLPYRLAEAGDGLVFAPHGLAGHAYDPATASDVDAVCAAASAAVEAVTYHRTATEPVEARAGGANVVGQQFGDGPFLVTTFAPEATDDVARAVGVDVLHAAGRGDVGAGEPVVTDAHNARASDGVDDGRTTPGTRRAEALVGAVERARSSMERASTGPLRVGVAADPTPFAVEDGVGPLGVRVLATEVGDARAAYVLVDGNNVVPDLRERLREAVHEAAPGLDVASVATTDSHAVNRLDATNYVGRSLDWSTLADCVAGTAASAVADLEPAEAGTATATATVTVLGEGTVDDVAAFADRVLPVCGAFVLGSSVLVTAVAVALFWLVGA